MKKINLYNISTILTSLFIFIYGIVMFSLSCKFSDYGEGSFNLKFNKEYMFILICGIICLGLSIYLLINSLRGNQFNKEYLGYYISIPSLIMFFYYLGKMIDLIINKEDASSISVKMVIMLVLFIWGISVFINNRKQIAK